ncbi:MAG: hypothetical protein RIM84_13305 [Alphaproteobacteria bacterium]
MVRRGHDMTTTTRRRLMARFGLLVGALTLAGTPRPAAALSRADQAVRALRAPAAARRVGRRYLAEHAQEADAARLAAHIEAALAARGDGVELRQALRNAVRADMRAGRSVLVDGWVLSLTEARLCALAALA